VANLPVSTVFTDGNALSAADLTTLKTGINQTYSTTYPNQLSFLSMSDSVLRPVPFATSTDKLSFSTNVIAGAGTSATVTFARSTRFTQNPIVTVTAETLPSTAYASTNVSAVSSTAFTWKIFNVGSVTITSYYIHYHAIQMTSAAADNN
jgi:hypothetical protein